MLPIDRTRIQAEYRRALGLQKAGRFEEAEGIHAALVRQMPRLAESHYQLGRIALARGRPGAAIAPLRTARDLRPREPDILRQLGQAEERAGDTAAAERTWAALIRLAPKDVAARAGRALALQRLGRFDDAEKEFRRALKIDPADGELYRMLLATKRLKPGDPLIPAMEAAHARADLPLRKRMHLDYALAWAMEQTGRHDRVFAHLDAANAAQRALAPHDRAQRRQEIAAVMAAFEGHDPAAAPAPAPGPPLPVFVTGMPRSGSTLVERILASHSRVAAGGEMTEALTLAYDLLGRPEAGMRRMVDVAPDEVAAFAARYRAALAARAPGAEVVTDKGLQSYLVLGLLCQALPDARVVVVLRDPRDQLLSIYRNHFAEGTHRYACDFGDLADYYAGFLEVLDFWRGRLPGRIHEVRYEELVAEPERAARALLEAVGLDWEPGVLDFHRQSGEVRTLSVQQVRQPINDRARGGWRRYETELAPLIAELEERGVL